MSPPPPPCELCGCPAVAFCVADTAFLCASCDLSTHSANFLLARHVRVRLCRNCHYPVTRTADESCQNCSPALNPNQIDVPCAPPKKRSRVDDEEEEDEAASRDKVRQLNVGVGKMAGVYNELSDCESYHDDKLTVRTRRKWARVSKVNTSPTRLYASLSMSAWDEYKEQEVLRRWHAASGMVSDNTVPLAVHFLERLGRPWLLMTHLSIPGMATRMQLMCLAGCLWIAARLTEAPTALEQACMLLPKCTGVPHNSLTVAEERLWKLFHWGTGKEEHATSP